MAAYYNEIDQYAAAWLRELIKAGLIADGEVDERDIRDVSPADVRGFTQCHFFAGIGGWSYALRLAGWPDDRPVWTGSCPCQPFSAAGTQAGGDDPRHLWPAWFQLVRECRPVVVFGEQVEAAINHGWFDLVSDDLEREGYAVGAAGLPACSVGAFHIRQRLWFVADTSSERRQQNARGASTDEGPHGRQPDGDHVVASDGEIDLADTDGWNTEHGAIQLRRQHGLRAEDRRDDGRAGDEQRAEGDGLADTINDRAWRATTAQQSGDRAHDGVSRADGGTGDMGHADITRPQGRKRAELRERADQRSSWPASNIEWIFCRDGKARPTKPGLFPLAYGVSNRVGILRGAGNAIVPQVAQAFIESYLETGRGMSGADLTRTSQ